MGSLGCLTDGTLKLLALALEHGGYIAGGFAVVVARHLLLQQPDLFAAILRHTRGQVGQYGGYHGDIDVWFPNAASLNQFLNDPRRLTAASINQFLDTPLRLTGTVVKRTVTGSAIEYVVDGDVKVQVVTRWLRPIEDQISHFDIYNAMVGLTNTTLVVPEHWEELERANVLHVHQWNSSYTMKRLFKYIYKKGYKALSPTTTDHLYDEVCKACEQHGAPTNYSYLGASLVECRGRMGLFQYRLKPIIASFSSEQLLQLSSLFTTRSNYDHAMQEIHRRMPVG